VNPYLIF